MTSSSVVMQVEHENAGSSHSRSSGTPPRVSRELAALGSWSASSTSSSSSGSMTDSGSRGGSGASARKKRERSSNDSCASVSASEPTDASIVSPSKKLRSSSSSSSSSSLSSTSAALVSSPRSAPTSGSSCSRPPRATAAASRSAPSTPPHDPASASAPSRKRRGAPVTIRTAAKALLRTFTVLPAQSDKMEPKTPVRTGAAAVTAAKARAGKSGSGSGDGRTANRRSSGSSHSDEKSESTDRKSENGSKGKASSRKAASTKISPDKISPKSKVSSSKSKSSGDSKSSGSSSSGKNKVRTSTSSPSKSTPIAKKRLNLDDGEAEVTKGKKSVASVSGEAAEEDGGDWADIQVSAEGDVSVLEYLRALELLLMPLASRLQLVAFQAFVSSELTLPVCPIATERTHEALMAQVRAFTHAQLGQPLETRLWKQLKCNVEKVEIQRVKRETQQLEQEEEDNDKKGKGKGTSKRISVDKRNGVNNVREVGAVQRGEIRLVRTRNAEPSFNAEKKEHLAHC